tara:strand:- start:1433 stop:2422 length:990 start_codon:yes stop_codon:yes gene_type:complete
MPSPFQTHLINTLREQVDPKIAANQPLRMFGPTGKEVNPADVGIDVKPVDTDGEVEVVDPPDPDDVENEEGEQPIDYPNGLEPVDVDGDGVTDHWVDAAGNIYDVTIISVNHNGVDGYMEVITYSYTNANGVTYQLGFVNNMWQLIGEVNGIPTLMPGVFIVNFQGGGTPVWGYQDHLGNYWFTIGDPYATNPPATWTNPLTGGQVAGDQVDYPQGWSVWMDFQFDSNGNPVGVSGIPLVPGGGQQNTIRPGASSIPGTQTGIFVGVNIPFPSESYGGSPFLHRIMWGHFVNLYLEIFGEHPPESSWPTNADWWDIWSQPPLGYGPPYS